MTQNEKLFPIVIDTNIFVHLLNPEKNVGNHISQFLAAIGSSHELCVDGGGRISGEYKVILGSLIDNADDLKFEIYLLRYWLKLKPICKVMKKDRHLGVAICKILPKAETVDQCFVTTAAILECDLIKNED